MTVFFVTVLGRSWGVAIVKRLRDTVELYPTNSIQVKYTADRPENGYLNYSQKKLSNSTYDLTSRVGMLGSASGGLNGPFVPPELMRWAILCFAFLYRVWFKSLGSYFT